MRTTKFFVIACAFALAGCDVVDELRDHLQGGGGPGPQPPPRACTLIGCEDALNVTLRPAEGTFPAGQHTLLVFTAGGGPVRRCTFDVPAAPFGQAQTAVGDCTAGVRAVIAPVVECTQTTVGGSVSSQCTPVPGRYEERVTVLGVHTRVRLDQRTSAGSLFVRDLVPSYRETQPNGPGCPPVCRQAVVSEVFTSAATPPPASACAPSQCLSSEDCASIRPGSVCVQRPMIGECVTLTCEAPAR